MRAKSLIPVLILACPALVPATPAAAMNWGVGTDLGLNVFMPSSDYGNVDNLTTFGWPLGGGLAQYFGVPGAGGIRVSFADEKLLNEVWIGTDLSYTSEEHGGSVHQFQATANYQYNFDLQSSMRPYVTAGVGMNNMGSSPETGSGISASSAVFGAGVGLSHWMGNGAGRLRAEVRFDVQTEGKAGGDILLPKGTGIGVKLGFDLWDRK